MREREMGRGKLGWRRWEGRDRSGVENMGVVEDIEGEEGVSRRWGGYGMRGDMGKGRK